MKAIIFVDNMKIGGYQRLALDQAYSLIDSGFNVTLNVLSQSKNWTLIELENSIIKEKKLIINQLPCNRIQLIKELALRTKIDANTIVISHSLRATFALRISRIYSRKNYQISTTIHQIPTLSHFTQRVKRFIYCQFSDHLYCFSQAVYDSWNFQFGINARFFLSRFGKKITLLRNGIYLGRLPTRLAVENCHFNPRIVFLGRPTFWKGLDTISELANQTELCDFDFLFIVPDEPNLELEELLIKLGDRAEVIRGFTIGAYKPRKGDVHIYPVNYGINVKKIESISLNCLEMGALGVPSLVSLGGLSTWPEFRNSRLYREVNWENYVQITVAIKLLSSLEISSEEQFKIMEQVNIANQIETILKKVLK